MYRLRAKQLEKFKQKEDLKTATKFIEKNIGKCHKTAVKQYFLKNHPINLTQVYQNWYSTRLCNNWKDFNIQLNKNVTVKLLFIDSYTKYIKGVLVITPQDIKERN